ncbi:MAG TPA: BTAD domain-containing putative transcriptional regulator [Natronosporangium sp.]
MIEFRVLGALEVVRNGAPEPMPSRRQRALVTRLLLGRGRVVPADALVDALWEDGNGDPPRDARHAVHTYISRVRAVLGPALVTRPPGYLLDVDPGAVDAARFEAAAARGAGLIETDPGLAAELLEEALALWRGPAYAEFADGFARAAAVGLAERRLAARADRAEALLALGKLDQAIGELGELVADQPLREGPHGLLMRALYQAGRQSEALEVYAKLRERLRDELGLDPSPALRAVHEQVLRQALPVGPDRPAAPPPAPAPTARSAATPGPRSRFVGRDGELARLAAAVGEGRLVTLVGPGGVGKTRLARELAGRLDDRPVWWVDLVPAREAADLPYRLIDAIGLAEPAEADLEQFVVDALRPARALLVMDNCEHVIGPVAQLVGQIAASCAGLAVLATSRERLAIDGEQVLPVPPLSADAAVALFTDRLRAAGGPELSGSDRALAADLCQQVDRLPLAIELAAARARSLGVAAVARRPALAVLTGGRRTGQPHHRSLRAVLDWSHDLLDSAERTLLRRLAAFAGAFTLDDAEAVCADGGLPAPRIATALAGLVDKSMVAGPEQDRYRLLASIQAYAAEQLAGHGEDTRLAAAHARHFTEFAERAAGGYRTSEEPGWSRRITERLDELRAAHRWACGNDADLAIRLAVSMADYAMYQMRFELQDWAEAAAALPAAAGHPLRPAALGSAACGAWARGDFVRADRLVRHALAAAPAGDPVAARATLVRGDLAMSAGRFADALQAYREAAELAGDQQRPIAVEALGGQAIAFGYQGELAEAVRWAEACQRVAETAGAPTVLAMARYYAGECRLVADPASALVLLDQARAMAAEAGARFVAGIAMLSSVSIRARAGADPAETIAAFGEAIEHWRRVGNRTQQWVTLRNLVPVLVQAGHDELAVTLHAALATAPVRLPADVPVPEAAALANAVGQARSRLPDQLAEAAAARGRALGLDELVATVLQATGSSR